MDELNDLSFFTLSRSQISLQGLKIPHWGNATRKPKQMRTKILISVCYILNSSLLAFMGDYTPTKTQRRGITLYPPVRRVLRRIVLFLKPNSEPNHGSLLCEVFYSLWSFCLLNIGNDTLLHILGSSLYLIVPTSAWKWRTVLMLTNKQLYFAYQTHFDGWEDKGPLVSFWLEM